MRLLVLGGTVFLSKAVAEEAVRRGHEVTCACRGTSGSVPEGARLVTWDRDQPVPADLWGGFDAVVDVARHPSRVRSAVAAFPDAHWVFVSTINVYSDESTPGGRPDTLPLHEPIHTDEDPASGSEVYGAMKVGCEQAVQEGASSWTVVRPGLIVGPGDPSGRYTYWPWRLSEAPTRPCWRRDRPTTWSRSSTSATWRRGSSPAPRRGPRARTTAPGRRPGSPTCSLRRRPASAPHPELVWVDQEFLTEQKRRAVEWRPLGAAVAAAAGRTTG